MQASKKTSERSEFLDALRKGVLLGAAILLLVLPPLHMMQKEKAPPAPPPVAQRPPAEVSPPMEPPVAKAPEVAVPAIPEAEPAEPALPPSPAVPPAPAVRLADFGPEEPTPEVRHIANWAVASKDHRRMGFVVVDKKDARVYVFGPDGRLKESAPALLGSAHGDHTVPGIGDKPLNQIKPDEKTTPAGRFIAEPGRNTKGEDIIWVDYDAAVSLHRVRPLVAAEQRLERLMSPSVEDNRISFGCINLPVTFYENVLSPTVKKHGAVIYVLPETKTPKELFGSYDPAGARVVRVSQNAS